MTALKPYFAASTPIEDRNMRICVGANGLLVLFCLAHLVLAFGEARLGWLGLGVALVVGYFLADLASGLVHWATDTWFTEDDLGGRIIAIAREHHTHPQHILAYRFIEHATLGSLPSALFIWPFAVVISLLGASPIGYLAMVFCFVVALCLLFGTTFHNLGHRHAESPLLRLAQRLHLVITPEHHMQHHRGDQTIRYCTVNGWANVICDRCGVWRSLEAAVQRLTGAIPRQNDLAWQRHFKRTGEMRALTR